MKFRGPMSYKKVIIISFFIHIICAIFSTGFLHFDEHFQIVEFLNLKLNGISPNELAWEYREKIRPWFQVYAYMPFVNFFTSFGIRNPFFLAFIMRLVTTLFAWWSTNLIYPVLGLWFKKEKYKNLAFTFLHLTWFIPFIHTRTSSESFSISFFFMGLAFLLDRPYLFRVILSGIFFGLCYQSRYQMALPIAVMWLVSLFLKKIDVKTLVANAFGIIIGFSSGFIFDEWGYGTFNFGLWHYYRTNIQEGIMANVQHYPWYWYFRWAFIRGIPPVSIPLIIGTLWFWIKRPTHILTLATIPLFIFHSLMGHKEVRYIFSIVVFSPIFLFAMLEFYDEKLKPYYSKKWFTRTAKFILAINIILLLNVSFRPANVAVNFYKRVWDLKIVKLYVKDEDPFTMVGLPLKFYRPPYLNTIIIKSFDEIDDKNPTIFTKTGEDFFKFFNNSKCELKTSTYPNWILKFNYGNWVGRSRVWAIFTCDF